MIIYGRKAKQLAKESLFDKCPNCSTQNSVDIYVFQKYGHLFWIPFFPMGKTGVSQCNHCKQALSLKQMPDTLRNTYENIKGQTKTPPWMFSGLALVAGLIIIGVINERNKDDRNQALIQSPQSGDIFEVKTGANQYTLYKVEVVKPDSVYLRMSNYETNRSTGLDDIKKKGPDAYSEDLFGYSNDDLKEMLNRGEILDIDRK